jgi:hypothetical protein
MPEPGLRPSTGVTRLLRYHEPLRLPRRPETDPFRSPRLAGATPPPTWISHVASKALCTCRLQYPGWRGRDLRSVAPPPNNGLPLISGGSAPARHYRGLLRVHAFRPAHLHPGCARDFSGGFSRAIAHLDCSSGYRAYRQFPGRDLHPLVFETSEVSPSTAPTQPDPLSCRTEN